MPTPAVLTIQSGINKLRYATLIGIKQAKNKPLRKVALAEVQSAIGENLQKIDRLYVRRKRRRRNTLKARRERLRRSLWISCGMRCACCRVEHESGVAVAHAENRFLGGLRPLGMTRSFRSECLIWADTILVVVEQREGN